MSGQIYIWITGNQHSLLSLYTADPSENSKFSVQRGGYIDTYFVTETGKGYNLKIFVPDFRISRYFSE